MRPPPNHFQEACVCRTGILIPTKNEKKFNNAHIYPAAQRILFVQEAHHITYLDTTTILLLLALRRCSYMPGAASSFAKRHTCIHACMHACIESKLCLVRSHANNLKAQQQRQTDRQTDRQTESERDLHGLTKLRDVCTVRVHYVLSTNVCMHAKMQIFVCQHKYKQLSPQNMVLVSPNW